MHLKFGAYSLELQIVFALKQLLLFGYDPDKVIKYNGNMKAFFEFYQSFKIFHGIESSRKRKNKSKKKNDYFQQTKHGNTIKTKASGEHGLDDVLGKMAKTGDIRYG